MSDTMPLEPKHERINQALKTFGQILIHDVLPALANIAVPLLLSYLTKKGITPKTDSTN